MLEISLSPFFRTPNHRICNFVMQSWWLITAGSTVRRHWETEKTFGTGDLKNKGAEMITCIGEVCLRGGFPKASHSASVSKACVEQRKKCFSSVR